MAKEEKKNGNGGAVAGAGNGAERADFSDLYFDAPEDAMAIGESYLYRPGDQKLPGVFSDEKDKQGKPVNGVQAGQPHCGWLPIQGIMVQAIFREAKEGSSMRDYNQLEIKLTAPCVGIEGDKLRRCKVGEMVVVKASGNLSSLIEAANDPKVCTEVYLRPTGEFVAMKDKDKAPMRKWEKKVLRQVERGLVNVPRLARSSDDSFDTKQLSS